MRYSAEPNRPISSTAVVFSRSWALLVCTNRVDGGVSSFGEQIARASLRGEWNRKGERHERASEASHSVASRRLGSRRDADFHRNQCGRRVRLLPAASTAGLCIQAALSRAGLRVGAGLLVWSRAEVLLAARVLGTAPLPRAVRDPWLSRFRFAARAVWHSGHLPGISVRPPGARIRLWRPPVRSTRISLVLSPLAQPPPARCCPEADRAGTRVAATLRKCASSALEHQARGIALESPRTSRRGATWTWGSAVEVNQ
jgi:hypothetical protein